MKICKKCGIEQENESFYSHVRSKDGLDSTCKNCRKLYQKTNSEHIKSQKKEYCEKNRDKLIDYKIKYKSENPEKVKLSNEKYQEKLKNDPIRLKKKRSYKPKNTQKRSIRKNISNYILKSLIKKGYKKESRSFEILGCEYDEFINYLESKFEHWMNWENRGLYNGEFNYGWDIDHIIPLSLGETKEDIIKLNHYTNLQPLCSKINRDIKRDLIL